MTENKLPGLFYHNYVALLAFLDESDSVRIGESSELQPEVVPENETDRADKEHSPFEFVGKARKVFEDACRAYGRAIVKNGKDFYGIESARILDNFPADHDRLYCALTPGFLYLPLTAHAFGHTDSMGFCLLDDFDPVFAITSEIESAIEGTSVAFCPVIGKLGLSDEEAQYLIEPHELFIGPRGKQLPFNEQSPLFAVTRFKVNGLASLGEGLLLQRALFCAIARRITTTLAEMARADEQAEQRDCFPLWRSRDHDKNETSIPPLQPKDGFRCVLLDTQGATEVTALMVCRNYSTAIGVVTALRCLTIGDLVDCEPSLERSLHLRDLHDSLRRVCQTRDDEQLLCGNHVFSESYTVLGVSDEAYRSPHTYPCSGFVNVSVNLDVNPGHLTDVVNDFKTRKDNCLQEIELGPSDNFLLFTVGRHDYTINSRQDGEGRLRAVDIRDYLIFNRQLFDHLNEIAQGRDETGLKDISTSFSVPFPKEILCRVPDSHAPLMVALQSIRNRLFPRDSVVKSKSLQEEQPKQLFSVEDLRIAMRQLRMPRRLGHTIQYLFQNFANCLSDPCIFDHVLDLYDPFATLYTLLTEGLNSNGRDRSKRRGSRLLGSSTDQIGLRKDMVDELTGFVSALEDALMHRITLTRPQHEFRDFAVDFRGGLNQLVAAADVTLKQGLYLLKWMAETKECTEAPASLSQHDGTGAVTRLTFHPGTSLHHVQLERLANQEKYCYKPFHFKRCLAYVEMNFGHIFHPAEFVHYIHESAHLIYDVVEGASDELNAYLFELGTRREGGESFSGRETMRIRIEEVYANLVTLFFVFGADTDLFLRHHVTTYDTQLLTSGNLVDTFFDFLEVMLRMFFVVDPIGNPDVWSDAPNSSRIEANRPLERSEIEAARSRFFEVLDNYGPLFREFATVWQCEKKREFRQAAGRHFDYVFPRAFWLADREWIRAKTTYERYALDYGVSDYGENTCCHYHEALSKGFAAIESSTSNGEETCDGETDNGMLMTVCCLLRAYLRLCHEPMRNRRIHLYRNSDGEIDYAYDFDRGKPWSVFQLETGYSGLFSVDPEFRQKRLMWDVTVLKILWGLSMRLKARELLLIVGDDQTDVTHFDNN